MTHKTIPVELLERVIRAAQSVRLNMLANAPELSGKVWGDLDQCVDDLRAALQAAPAQPVNQVLVDALERIKQSSFNASLIAENALAQAQAQQT